MDVDALLAKARQIAETAHRGQVDKAGKPYISHPVRVAGALEDPEAKMVGLLHDTVEDTEVTLEDLSREGFPPHVVDAVDAVTKRAGEDREAYYARVIQNRLALVVKIADMTDNLDPTRIAHPTPKDRSRVARYEEVLPRLVAALEQFDE